MEEPGRLQSMGSWRVGHDWATSLSIFTFMHWRRKWQPIPVFLPGESQGWRSLVGCRLWGRTESDTTDVTLQQQQQHSVSGLVLSTGEAEWSWSDSCLQKLTVGLGMQARRWGGRYRNKSVVVHGYTQGEHFSQSPSLERNLSQRYQWEPQLSLSCTQKMNSCSRPFNY